MGLSPIALLHPDSWISESSQWRAPAVTLLDEAGVAIGSQTMTTMTLTLYDAMDPTLPIVAGVQGVDCKNARSCTLSAAGVFLLTLLPADTGILMASRTYEIRKALVQYTWASGAKQDALEITVVIRNVAHRGPADGSTASIGEVVTVELI